MRAAGASFRTLALAALVALQCAPGAAAQDASTSGNEEIGSQPASSTELVDAVGECFKFVKHHGQVDHEGLKAAGWKFGGKQEQPARGLMPATTNIILGKGNVIMVLQLTGISASCQSIGRVDDLARVSEVREGIAQRYGAKPIRDYQGDEVFKAGMARQLKPEDFEKIMISDAARFTVSPIAKDDTKLITVMMIPRILD